ASAAREVQAPLLAESREAQLRRREGRIRRRGALPSLGALAFDPFAMARDEVGDASLRDAQRRDDLDPPAVEHARAQAPGPRTAAHRPLCRRVADAGQRELACGGATAHGRAALRCVRASRGLKYGMED